MRKCQPQIHLSLMDFTLLQAKCILSGNKWRRSGEACCEGNTSQHRAHSRVLPWKFRQRLHHRRQFQRNGCKTWANPLQARVHHRLAQMFMEVRSQITCPLISIANLSLFHTYGTKIRFPHLILHQVKRSLCLAPPACVCVHAALQLTSLTTNLFRPKVWIPVWGQDREKEAELENLVTWRERTGSRRRALGRWPNDQCPMASQWQRLGPAGFCLMSC